MRRVAFDQAAFKDFSEWAVQDKRTYQKIIDLIQAIIRDPFQGIGKPEALKGDLQGAWSRRINEKHRLVYRVTETEVLIESCKYHYSDH